MSRYHWPAGGLRVGDRVEHVRAGDTGVIHALYSDDFEDDVEVRLDRGGYSGWWSKYTRVLARHTPLREAGR